MLETYQNTKDIHKAYENARDKESFLMENETELILYEGAANRLSEMGIIPSDETLKELKEKYKSLKTKKKILKQKTIHCNRSWMKCYVNKLFLPNTSGSIQRKKRKKKENMRQKSTKRKGETFKLRPNLYLFLFNFFF